MCKSIQRYFDIIFTNIDLENWFEYGLAKKILKEYIMLL